MNRTVTVGEDNPALDVESRKAANKIREDSAARKKNVVDSRKQNVFETQTVGRNEQAAKTEQAINPKKRSDSIDDGEIIVFHGRCFIVISLLIASTGLV